MTYDEVRKMAHARSEAVSRNRSRRLRGLPPLPVPPKPPPKWELVDDEGTYQGCCWAASKEAAREAFDEQTLDAYKAGLIGFEVVPASWRIRRSER